MTQPTSPYAALLEGPSGPRGWRHTKALIIGEFALFAGIFIADWQGLIWGSKTPLLLALGWISLRLSGLGWKDLGWARYRTWKRTLLVAIAAGLAISAFELFVSGPLLTRLTGQPANLEDLRPLVGSWKLLLLVLAGNWTLAAFGEEMVYRGYLLNRLADLGRRTRPAWMAALMVSSAVFAFAHTYQEITGVVEAGIDGLWLGLLYLACDRKLSVPIIAHGMSNMPDLILIYLGKYPGM
jgi:membrane protease YdiL (CAAX protease family)